MRLFWSEIEHAFVGCWRVLRGDQSGLALIDVSVDGFWRSFRIAAVLAVLDAIDGLVAQAYALGDEISSLTLALAIGVMLLGAVTSVLAFCAFPLAVGMLAKPMAITARYGPYITVRNWLTAFLSLPIYVLNGLTYANAVPGDVLALLVLAYEVIVLFAGYAIARALLGCSHSIALGFSLMDFLLALVITKMAYSLF